MKKKRIPVTIRQISSDAAERSVLTKMVCFNAELEKVVRINGIIKCIDIWNELYKSDKSKKKELFCFIGHIPISGYL